MHNILRRIFKIKLFLILVGILTYSAPADANSSYMPEGCNDFLRIVEPNVRGKKATRKAITSNSDKFSKIIESNIASMTSQINFSRDQISKKDVSLGLVELSTVFNRLDDLTLGQDIHPCIKPYLLSQILTASRMSKSVETERGRLFYQGVYDFTSAQRYALLWLKDDRFTWEVSDLPVIMGSKNTEAREPEAQPEESDFTSFDLCDDRKFKVFFSNHTEVVIIPERDLIAFDATFEMMPNLITRNSLIVASIPGSKTKKAKETYCYGSFLNNVPKFTGDFPQHTYYVFDSTGRKTIRSVSLDNFIRDYQKRD